MGLFKNIGNGRYSSGTNPNDTPLPTGFFQRIITIANALLMYIYNGTIWIKARLFARNIGNKKELLKPILTKYQDYRTLKSENDTIRINTNVDDNKITIEDSTYTSNSLGLEIKDFFYPCYYAQTDLDNIGRTTTKDIKIANVNNTLVNGYKTFEITLPLSLQTDFNPIIAAHPSEGYKWRVYINKSLYPNLKIEKYANGVFYHNSSTNLVNGNAIELFNPFVNYTNVQYQNEPLKKSINGASYTVDGISKTIKYHYVAGYIPLENKLIVLVGLVFTDNTSCITYATLEDLINPDSTNSLTSQLTLSSLSTTPLITQATADFTLSNNKSISSRSLTLIEKLGDGSNKYIGVGFSTFTNSTQIVPIYYTLQVTANNQSTTTISILDQPRILNFDPVNFILGTGTNQNNLVWANSITKYRGKWRIQFWNYSDYLAVPPFTNLEMSDHFEVVFDLPLEYIVAGVSRPENYTKTTIHIPINSPGILKGLGIAPSYTIIDDKLYLLHAFDNRNESLSYLTKNNYEYNIAELNSDGLTWSWDKSGPYIMNPVEWTDGSGETGFIWQKDHMGGGTYMFKYKNSWYLFSGACNGTDTYRMSLLKLRDYYKGKELKDYVKSSFKMTSPGNYNQGNQDIIIADCNNSGTYNILLKSAAEWVGKEIRVKKYGNTGTLTVTPYTGNTINGASLPFYTITTNDTICYRSISQTEIITL